MKSVRLPHGDIGIAGLIRSNKPAAETCDNFKKAGGWSPSAAGLVYAFKRRINDAGDNEDSPLTAEDYDNFHSIENLVMVLVDGANRTWMALSLKDLENRGGFFHVSTSFFHFT